MTSKQQEEEQHHSPIIRRSRMETYCDILQAIGSGLSKPTHIMLRANLTSAPFREYLTKLQARGIVVCELTGEWKEKEYRLSKEGSRVLDHFRSIKQDLNLE